MTTPYQIRCAEIWGGINAVNTDVCTRGLTASIHSTASGGRKGGDIYYLSVCEADILTRIAVADMRGHGEEVSHLSAWLYRSLNERMNTLDGAGVLADLNQSVHQHGFEALTTAVVLSYNQEDSTLHYSYAGHPPILVAKQDGEWRTLPLDAPPGPANLPLGVMCGVRYDQPRITLQRGDRLFLYTDGLVECPDPAGEEYGEERLTAVLSQTAGQPLDAIKDAVFTSLRAFAGGELLHDDCTFLVVELR